MNASINPNHTPVIIDGEDLLVAERAIARLINSAEVEFGGTNIPTAEAIIYQVAKFTGWYAYAEDRTLPTVRGEVFIRITNDVTLLLDECGYLTICDGQGRKARLA